MAGDFPDKIDIPIGQSTVVTFTRAVTDLAGPGKKNKWNKSFWITRVDHAGTEKTWFLDPPERDALLEAGIQNGQVLNLTQVGKYATEIELVHNQSGAPDVAAPASNPVTAGPPAPPSNWTTNFPHKPDLNVVPGKEGTAQAQIYDRFVGPVSTGLARRARSLVLEMCNIVPSDKVTAAQMTAMAPAMQAAFATLAISWKDLGYPLTEFEVGGLDGLPTENMDFD